MTDTMDLPPLTLRQALLMLVLLVSAFGGWLVLDDWTYLSGEECTRAYASAPTHAAMDSIYAANPDCGEHP